jgi:hypothetical protein
MSSLSTRLPPTSDVVPLSPVRVYITLLAIVSSGLID